MRHYVSRYFLSYPRVLLYMLQDTEYKLVPYLAWVHRTDDFRLVIKRRKLVLTKKVQLLLATLRLISFALFIAVTVAIIYGIATQNGWWIAGGVVLALVAPFILSHGLLLPLSIGYVLIQKPQERRIIRKARKVLNEHQGVRIVVAGSYGKTTAKETLLSVIGAGMKTAATPGNMNTAIGISRFAMKLKGDEEVLIFELGEEREDDIRPLAELAQPDIALVTGINESHLANFKSLNRTAATILAVADFVKPEDLYLNGESSLVRKYKQPGGQLFSQKGVGGWKVTNASTAITGTKFTLTKGEQKIRASTGLIGLHTIGVTVAAAVIATKLGVSIKKIEEGLKNVKAFEHRMEPRLFHGAWLIDDTYNGNSDGVKAGLAFLKEQKAKRRIYVTPGLVEQGDKTQEVHEKIGEHIAESADVVVLMNNSVTGYIMNGLDRKKFQGQLIIEDDPLFFYTNLDQFVAAGDVVLMQNDWTDNYR